MLLYFGSVVFLPCFSAFSTGVFSDDFKTACEAQPNGKLNGGSCFVPVAADKFDDSAIISYDDHLADCENATKWGSVLGKGRIPMPMRHELVNAFHSLMYDSVDANRGLRVAIQQMNKTDEPSGNWMWKDSRNGELYSQPPYGSSAMQGVDSFDNADGNQDCAKWKMRTEAVMENAIGYGEDLLRLDDLSCSDGMVGVCEFLDRFYTSHFVKKATGGIGPPVMFIMADRIVNFSIVLDCLKHCNDIPSCQSFTHDALLGTCTPVYYLYNKMMYTSETPTQLTTTTSWFDRIDAY